MANLKLVSSNKYPTRKISDEGLEAIRKFLSSRSAMYKAITEIEEVFKMEISYDLGESHMFELTDFNFSDWPAEQKRRPSAWHWLEYGD